MYQFKVGWCPLCNQGWGEIIKNQMTEQLLLYCNECDTHWKDFDEYKKDDILAYLRQYEEVNFEECYTSNDGGEDDSFHIIKPSYQEIKNKGGEKYILKDELIFHPNYVPESKLGSTSRTTKRWAISVLWLF